MSDRAGRPVHTCGLDPAFSCEFCIWPPLAQLHVRPFFQRHPPGSGYCRGVPWGCWVLAAATHPSLGRQPHTEEAVARLAVVRAVMACLSLQVIFLSKAKDAMQSAMMPLLSDEGL